MGHEEDAFARMGITRRDFGAVAAGAGALTAGLCALGLGASSGSAAEADEIEGLADRLQRIEDRLWVAEAKEAIRRKLYLYCRGDDRQDPETGKLAFAENSHVDYGTHPLVGKVFEGPGREWSEYCAGTVDPGITASGGFYQHYYCNILIYVNGQKAGSETYSYCPQISLKDDGSYVCTTPVSRHCDKWEYIDGDWYIVERETTTDFNYAWTVDSVMQPYANSKMGKEDFSYEFLAYGMSE